MKLSLALISILISVIDARRSNGFLNSCDRNTLDYNDSSGSNDWGTLKVKCAGVPKFINLQSCISNSNGYLVWNTENGHFAETCGTCKIHTSTLNSIKQLRCTFCFKPGGVKRLGAAINLDDGIGYEDGTLICN
ncbi:hypothetical protein DSL72_003552 [Monilinia vaccinii-corymbosi]|uniref:Cyanovirin-N domain-containing protein n=1 Tax=Monilinia vaccinii-corymbosi TaxID=61207 RepID=A0A8A3NX43_9HELO|nr:hypothetical protein DSL72_003552 [Monilinia vaccinii-corymbosi]